MQGPNRSIDFRRVIDALRDLENPFPPAYLRHFSDLERSHLEQLKSVWPQIDPERRLEVMVALVVVSAEDTLVCFDMFAQYALTDTDPRVRTEAVRLLEECPDPKVAEALIDMMQHDVDPATRAAAAYALGSFEYMGELEEIPEDLYAEVESSLLDVIRGPDLPVVRRRALESLGFSSNEQVLPLIELGFESGEEEWMVSAVLAMGRSLDSRWAPDVMLSMRSELPSVRLAAVTAAGMLELQAARQSLLEMLEDPDQLTDPLRRAAIWSLSQIGGEEVGAALEYLLQSTEDEKEIQFLDDALENLEFTEGFPNFDLMEIDPELAAVVEDPEKWPEPSMEAGDRNEGEEDEPDLYEDNEDIEDSEDD